MTPEERAALDAIRAWATAGYPIKADSTTLTRLECAAENLVTKLQWILRTWADVRAGDTVRMPGTDYTATIAARYAPPAADRKAARVERGQWHIIPGATGHWDDHPVRPGEVWVVFTGQTHLRNMDPTKPVEIQLSAVEVAAIELIGWENRVELRHDA